MCPLLLFLSKGPLTGLPILVNYLSFIQFRLNYEVHHCLFFPLHLTTYLQAVVYLINYISLILLDTPITTYSECKLFFPVAYYLVPLLPSC